MSLPQIHDLRSLLARRIPLLDVRAPVEFSAGALPSAENHPLLNDREREAVGLEYRQHGPSAALALGHQLISGSVRGERLSAWLDWARRNPSGVLYCFRGGSRSRFSQEWLAEAGVEIPRVQGGYKALRRHLLEFLANEAPRMPLRVVSGATGCGKTRIVAALEPAVDLEALANHRGSAFGRLPGTQPTQINFENALAIEMLRYQAGDGDRSTLAILVEDESKLIGQRVVPPLLLQAIRRADHVRIDEPLESRVELILEEYVVTPVLQLTTILDFEQAVSQRGQELMDALDRIRNRLGSQRHAELRAQLECSLSAQVLTGRADEHRGWIARLLLDYYDPLYAHAMQRQQRSQPPLHSGTRAEVERFLLEQGWRRKIDSAPVPHRQILA
jgi:tRNA 2-selenouridine synthase